MKIIPNRYVVVLDIAGLVTEDVAGKEFLTTGGVALLPDTLDALRAAVVSVKWWKNGASPPATLLIA